MIGQADLHPRRDLQFPMRPTEMVEGEMEGHGGVVMLKGFTMGIRPVRAWRCIFCLDMSLYAFLLAWQCRVPLPSLSVIA